MANKKFSYLGILLLGLVTLLLFYLYRRNPDAVSDVMISNMLYLLILLVFLGSSLVVRAKNNMPLMLKSAVLWCAILFFLVLGYSFRFDFVEIKDRVVTELLPSRGQFSEPGVVRYVKSRDGHFHIDLKVEGYPVSFLLDTGASDIVLSKAVARRIGIDIEKLNYNKLYYTANGTVTGASVVLKEVQLADYVFLDVVASVNNAPLNKPLLGMRFLNLLDGYEVQGDELFLRP